MATGNSVPWRQRHGLAFGIGEARLAAAVVAEQRLALDQAGLAAVGGGAVLEAQLLAVAAFGHLRLLLARHRRPPAGHLQPQPLVHDIAVAGQPDLEGIGAGRAGARLAAARGRRPHRRRDAARSPGPPPAPTGDGRPAGTAGVSRRIFSIAASAGLGFEPGEHPRRSRHSRAASSGQSVGQQISASSYSGLAVPWSPAAKKASRTPHDCWRSRLTSPRTTAAHRRRAAACRSRH